MYQVLDSNPAYETAYTESNMGSQIIDKNVEFEEDEVENGDHRSNSDDQLDDYDYMGN